MKISPKQQITIETLEQLDTIHMLDSVANQIGSGFAASDLFSRTDTKGIGDLFAIGEKGSNKNVGLVFVVVAFDAVAGKWIVEDTSISRISKYTLHPVNCGYPPKLSWWSDRQKDLFIQWWNNRAEQLIQNQK